MEAVLHLEISKLWSRNLLDLHTKSSAEFDYEKNVMTKRGNALKVKDLVKRLVDKNGKPSEVYHSWEVVELKLHDSLRVKDMAHGEFYYIYERKFGGLVKFQLVSIDIGDGTYTFQNKEKGITNEASVSSFPSVYQYDSHTSAHTHNTFKSIVFQCIEKGKRGGFVREEIDFDVAKNVAHIMDVGQTNIAFGTGKPAGSKNHFKLCPDVSA